jgi:hypothetical protein
MRRLAFVCLWLAVSLALSVVGGGVWWSLWMNRGWPGSPGLLKRVLGADGEYAYDATQWEMTLIVWVVVVALGLIGFAARRGRRRQ